MLLTYHETHKIFRWNEMKSRAYFIPFESEEKLGLPREKSGFFHSLNGPWQFLYKDSYDDMDDIYGDGYYREYENFKTVNVPECWQTHGADRAQYQTSPYPFLFDPPRVPRHNPCAAYIRDFTVPYNSNKRYELHFEGKDSCIYVFLNGKFVGYSESPHCDSIFDITQFLMNGTNQLCVMMMKWCSGSYLDDQDKIRLSGLFRDVYILERECDGIEDIHLRAELNGTVHIEVSAGDTVAWKIQKNGQTLATGFDNGTAFVPQPALWSAETPTLYELILFCKDEYVCIPFGFREFANQNGVFTVNGKPVKLYGVNRHDFSPLTGYALSEDFIAHELSMMKRGNINAIRTAHYPNDPRFYQLCDKMGFYVLSEADVECHGCAYTDGWNMILEDPYYGAAILDRVQRMYHNFKNATCIFSWSLGNESGWGTALKNAAKYIKSVDQSRLLHYEGWASGGGDAGATAHLSPEDRAFVLEHFDFNSRMYPTLDSLKKVPDDEISRRMPFLMCEYSHAMGNSCGDLRFYDQVIQSNPVFAGGFIWEWCDQALVSRNCKPSYLQYGGDFGEFHHMGNLCMDGVVDPWRRAHSAYAEMKAVFAPVRVSMTDNGKLKIQNRNVFLNLKDYQFIWEVRDRASMQDRGTLDISCEPGCSTEVDMPCIGAAQPDTVLMIRVRLEHEVAVFTFELPYEPQRKTTQVPPPKLLYDRTFEMAEAGQYLYVFRRDTGLLTQIYCNDVPLLDAPMEFCCFRAPTDNDNSFQTAKNVANLWRNSFYFGNIEYPQLQARYLLSQKMEDHIQFTMDFLFGVPGRMLISQGEIIYRVYGDGRLEIEHTAVINAGLPYWLPRYGYVFHFKDPLNQLTYFGYGPVECYEDKCSHAWLDRHFYIVDDEYAGYEKPQECNSHLHTKWLDINTPASYLRFEGDFSFSASRYDVHEYAKHRHRYEMQQSGGTHIHIDYRMSGVGSASCGGQQPLQGYRIEPGEKVNFTVIIRPQ